ncbi:MAG TPA: ArsI/CadI family heavy metal resistance metalloenzyme [Pyrinomonadaceae bacterium]
MEDKTAETVKALKAHLALNVKSVERSIDFYRRLLGLEPSKVRAGYAKFDVQNPLLNLTLNEVAFKERGALSHLGIQVASTDDVLATRDRWGRAGLLTRDEMQTNCCYAFQDKAWVADPDGNEWEVFVVLEDNLQESPACCGTTAAPEKIKLGEVETQTGESATCSTATVESTAAASSCCGGAASSEPVAISR